MAARGRATDASSVASGTSSVSGASNSGGAAAMSEAALHALTSAGSQSLPDADGAPILVIAKLFDTFDNALSHAHTHTHAQVPGAASAQGINPRSMTHPSVTTSGDALTINVVSRSGSLVRTQSVECDSVYPAETGCTELCGDAVTPVAVAVAEGVNALLVVAGNDPLVRRVLFDGIAGAGHTSAVAAVARAPSPCELGAIGFAAETLMQTLDRKRESMNVSPNADGTDVFSAEVHVSYCAVDDRGVVDLFEQRVRDSPGTADVSSELCIVEDDHEGVYVRGLTTFGPVPDLDAMLQLLRAGSSTMAAMCDAAWASGSAYGIVHCASKGAAMFPSPDAAARAPMRRRLSSVVRITIDQVIRVPGAPVNALKSHLYIVDLAGLETLAPSYSSTSGPTLGLPTSSSDGLEPCMNAKGFKAIAELMAYYRARPTVPFSLASSAQFGLRDRIKAELDAQRAQARRARSRQGRAGSKESEASSGGMDEAVGKDRAVEAAVLSLNSALARDPAVSPYAVSPLTQLLAECLGGNCLTVALCALATHGAPPDASLVVLEAVSALRRGQCYPVVASTSARGLLRQYRRTIRQLRSSMHKLQEDVFRARSQLEQIRSAPDVSARSDESGSRPESSAGSEGEGVGSRTSVGHRSRAPEAVTRSSSKSRDERGERGDKRTSRRRGSRSGSERDEEDTRRLASVPEDATVWEQLSAEYHARIADLSQQVMELELENSLLRDAVDSDRLDLVERLETAETGALEAEARRQVSSEKLEKLRGDMDDLMTELATLQNNVRNKVKDLRSAKERIGALEQQLDVANTRSDASSKTDPRAAERFKIDEAFRRRAALLQQCIALRHRIASMTTDAEEYRRFARSEVSEEDVLREAPADGPVLSDVNFITDPATGHTLSYAQLTERHHAQGKQSVRMRSVLEEAGAHIRSLRDKLSRARAQAAAAVAAAAADVDGMLTSPVQPLSRHASKPADEPAKDAEIRRLKDHVAVLRNHLVRARDALVATKQRRSVAGASRDREDARGEVIDAAHTALRAQLAAVHERSADLERENARLRKALDAANRGVTLHADSNSLLGELQASEKRCVELMSENAVLAGQVDEYKAQIKAVSSKYERIIAKLRAAMRRSSVGGNDLASPPPGLAPPDGFSDVDPAEAYSDEWGRSSVPASSMPSRKPSAGSMRSGYSGYSGHFNGSSVLRGAARGAL